MKLKDTASATLVGYPIEDSHSLCFRRNLIFGISEPNCIKPEGGEHICALGIRVRLAKKECMEVLVEVLERRYAGIQEEL